MPYNKDGEYITWRQVFFGNKKSTYIFWTLIVVMMFLTVKDLIKTISEYLEYEKSVDMVVRFNNSMAMPNITLCMPLTQAQMFMDWGKLKNMTSNEERRKYWDGKINSTIEKLSVSNNLLREKWPPEFLYDVIDVLSTLYLRENTMTTIGTIRQMSQLSMAPQDAAKKAKVKKYLSLFKHYDLSIEQVRQKAGTEALQYQMRRFQRLTKNDERKVVTYPRITWLSVEEMCFQPTFHEEVPVDFQGAFFTLTAQLNMQNLLGADLDCLTADVSGRPSSFWRHHLNHGRDNNGVLEDLCFGDRHDITTTVKAYYRMLEDDDVEGGTACRQYEPGEEVECHAKCRKQLVQENLDCTPVTLEYLAEPSELARYPRCDYDNLKAVGISNITDTEKDCREKCFRDCNYIKYEVRKSVARHTSSIIAQTRAKSDPSEMAKLVKQLSQEVPHNELTVNFLFASFEYMDCEQDWEESWVEFMGNIGGVLGLWLGLSAISFVQAVVYFYHQCKKRSEEEKARDEDDVIARKLSSSPFGDVTLSQNPFGGDDAELKQRRKTSMASWSSADRR